MSTQSTIDIPRKAALELLGLVRDEGAYANLALAQVLKNNALNGRDAAFTVELAYGVLRNQMLYDSLAQACADREITAIEPALLDIIRMGIHQIVAMRVPDHAAVDSSVNLARLNVNDAHGKAKAGFVNAILRCVVRNLESDSSDINTQDLSLAVKYSHPEWIIDSYREALNASGRSASELEALLKENNTPAKPVLAIRSGESEIDGTSSGRWSTQARVVESTVPQDIEAVRLGHAIVQDEGSQLVAQAFLLSKPIGPESAWLDMCAGPGGKAALISDSVPSGVTFTAVELHAHRARLIERIVNPETSVLVADARTRPWGNQFFDRILVDAPCTGLGALRRRPEARWRKQERDLYELTSLQEDLLNAALDSVRGGGIVCYVTCSPHVEETRMLVRSVLEERGGAQLEDARPLFPGIPDLGSGPDVQLWPHVHGTDAMYFALIRRN